MCLFSQINTGSEKISKQVFARSCNLRKPVLSFFCSWGSALFCDDSVSNVILDPDGKTF
jgi:hypothetical protein